MSQQPLNDPKVRAIDYVRRCLADAEATIGRMNGLFLESIFKTRTGPRSPFDIFTTPESLAPRLLAQLENAADALEFAFEVAGTPEAQRRLREKWQRVPKEEPQVALKHSQLITLLRDAFGPLEATYGVGPQRVQAPRDPWSYHPADEQHDKWPKLLRHSCFASDVERAIVDASSARPLALMFADIDDFKGINTALTEPVTDRVVLARLTPLFSEIVGRRGRSYLVGGEEVVVLLPDFTEAEAAIVAERLRMTIAERSWEGYQGRITLSIGVAQFPAAGVSDSAGLLQAAVDAEKRAKSSGKNQVRLASEGGLSLKVPTDSQPMATE